MEVADTVTASLVGPSTMHCTTWRYQKRPRHQVVPVSAVEVIPVGGDEHKVGARDVDGCSVVAMEVGKRGKVVWGGGGEREGRRASEMQ